LSFEQWSDQSGQKNSKHGVIVETMQMLDSIITRIDVENMKTTPVNDPEKHFVQSYKATVDDDMPF
jgi:single-strand DNA-binding protein